MHMYKALGILRQKVASPNRCVSAPQLPIKKVVSGFRRHNPVLEPKKIVNLVREDEFLEIHSALFAQCLN